MKNCNNEVTVDRPLHFGYITFKYKCNTIGHNGNLILCPTCKTDFDKKYPQGWRNVPGDICEHGNFVGDIFGPDHICGLCGEVL